MRKTLFVLGVAALGCSSDNSCDYQYGEYCGGQNTAPCAAQIINGSEWESGPLVGSWLGYGHNMDWHMHLRDSSGAVLTGTIDHYEAQISPAQIPNGPQGVGNEAQPCAGNLCEWSFQPDGDTGSWVFDVHNDSCADYYVWVHVWMQPGTSAITDGGTRD